MKNPERDRARNKVNNEIKAGRLERPDTCEHCGSTDQHIQASHSNYFNPLNVEWLCPPCHWQKDNP
jgi:hypothetical protein